MSSGFSKHFSRAFVLNLARAMEKVLRNSAFRLSFFLPKCSFGMGKITNECACQCVDGIVMVSTDTSSCYHLVSFTRSLTRLARTPFNTENACNYNGNITVSWTDTSSCELGRHVIIHVGNNISAKYPRRNL
jgi:hypothetical protein